MVYLAYQGNDELHQLFVEHLLIFSSRFVPTASATSSAAVTKVKNYAYSKNYY